MGKQGEQNHGVKRQGVTHLKVLEEPFNLEQVGQKLRSVPGCRNITLLMGDLRVFKCL